MRRFRTVARMSLEADRGLTVRVLLFSIANWLMGAVVGAVLVKLLTNAVVRGHWRDAEVVTLLLAGFMAGSFLVARLYGRTYPVLQERNREHYDQMILRLTATIPGIEHYENTEYLNELEQLRFQPQALGQMLAVSIQMTSLLVQTAVVTVLLALIDVRLVLVPLLAVPALFAMRLGQSSLFAAWDETAESARLSNELFGLLTSPAPGREIRMLRLEEEMVSRHEDAWSHIDRTFVRAGRRASLITTGGWIIFAMAFVAMIGVAVQRAARGDASVGDVVLTVALATQLNRQIATMLEVVNRIVRNSRAVGRFLWLQDYAAASAPAPGTGHPAPDRMRTGIEIRDLDFHYPGTDPPVLSGMTTTLPAGSVVALLGENGAGKTTLVKLLTGMYRAPAGSITVDGVALDELDIAEWRARTTAAFQDFARLELTAGESVGVGDLPFLHDDVRVVGALRRAGAEDIVGQLPLALATPLGGTFTGGADLSGGQWQKIALGRAMMRDAPLLLILDEPTASLDPIAERSLFERYIAWAHATGKLAGTITLLISHRYSTTRNADLIVLLDHGRIVEQGSHDELMARDGLYAELYELQARAYR